MINKISKTLWARCGIVAVLLGLAGCTGMYMGLESQDEEVPQLTQEQIHASADIRRITPRSVHRMLRERQHADDMAQVLHDVAEQLGPKIVHYSYLIAPRDVLLVTVWNHPELNKPSGQLPNELAGRTVGPDGPIFYPYTGR